MLLLNQPLTSSERQAALQASITFGHEYHIVNFRRPEDRQPGEPPVPTGAHAVPTQSPTGLTAKWGLEQETFSNVYFPKCKKDKIQALWLF